MSTSPTLCLQFGQYGGSFETVLLAGNGIVDTMMDWGNYLTGYFYKPPSLRENDFSINYLGLAVCVCVCMQCVCVCVCVCVRACIYVHVWLAIELHYSCVFMFCVGWWSCTHVIIPQLPIPSCSLATGRTMVPATTTTIVLMITTRTCLLL